MLCLGQKYLVINILPTLLFCSQYPGCRWSAWCQGRAWWGRTEGRERCTWTSGTIRGSWTCGGYSDLSEITGARPVYLRVELLKCKTNTNVVSLFQGPTGVSGPKGARGAQGAPVSIFCFHYNPVFVLNVHSASTHHASTTSPTVQCVFGLQRFWLFLIKSGNKKREKNISQLKQELSYNQHILQQIFRFFTLWQLHFTFRCHSKAIDQTTLEWDASFLFLPGNLKSSSYTFLV